MSKETKARVSRAFRAMKAIGISEDKVRPVLKNLLKLYKKKNWALIEKENYRALADAISDRDEQKVAEEVNPKKRKAAQVVEDSSPPVETPSKRSEVRTTSSFARCVADFDSPPYLAAGSLEALEQACPEGMHKWLSETSPANVFDFLCQSAARGFLGMRAAQRCYDSLHRDHLNTTSKFEALRRDHDSCQSLESDRVTLVAKLKECEEKLKQAGEAHLAELAKVKAGYESELSHMMGALQAKLSEAEANYESELSKVKELQSDLARAKKDHDLHLDSCSSSISKLEEELTSLKAALPDVRAKAIEEYKIADAYMLKMIRENRLMPDDIVDYEVERGRPSRAS